MSQMKYFPHIDETRKLLSPMFYVVRPDFKPVPLFPLDELPSWLQFGFWNFEDPFLYLQMELASPKPVERVREYDVICQNCCSHSPGLSRSVSERTENKSDSPVPKFNEIRSFPGAYCHIPMMQHPNQLMVSDFWPLNTLKQPLFLPQLQTPYVGMCLVDYKCPEWTFDSSRFISSVLPGSIHGSRSPAGSDLSRKSSLNPEADVFDPPIKSTPITPPTPMTPVSDIDAGDMFPVPFPLPFPMSLPITDSSSCGGTGLNAGPNTPDTPTENGDSALDKDLNIAVDQLRQMLGIKNEKTVPVPGRKKVKIPRYLRKVRHRNPVRNRNSNDSSGPLPFPRSNAFHQDNAATKRAARRFRVQRRMKKTKASSRYWYMMKIPNWRKNAPK